MEVKNGVITGQMLSDNCVRQWKAQRLTEWLSKHDPFADSWGYGNVPHDSDMLNLLKNQIIISR